MNNDSVFEKRIGTLLRWRKRKRLLFFLVWFLALSLILNTLAFGLQKWFLSAGDSPYLYLVLTLISFEMALGFYFLTRNNLLADLIEIDSRLRLKDRLSTAFEYMQSGKKSPFKEKLLTDAGRVLEELPRNKLFPSRFSAAYVLIPLFGSILTGLILFDFSISDPNGERTKERLARVGLAIEKFSRDKIRESIGRNDPSLGEPYRRLEDLAKELQDQSLRQEKLLLTLGQMKKEALADRLRLTRKLEKELNADGSPGPASPFALPKDLASTKDLEKFTEQLKDLFENGLPESVAKDISRIGEKLELEQFLEKAIQQAIPSEPGGDEQSLLAKRGKGYAEGDETREKLEKQPSREARPPLGPEKEQDLLSSPPKSGKGPGDNRETGKRTQDRADQNDFTAGTSPGTGERLLPFELKGGKGPTFKEGGGYPGLEPGPSFQTRALPLFGKTENSGEEIQQKVPASYRREMEAALLKEKIPREYQEYIKHYFLSIRQEKGKKQDDKNR